MGQKHYLRLIALILILITLLFASCNCYATEVTDENSSITDEKQEENDKLKQEELNKIIKDLLQELKEKVLSFEKKIETIRDTDEYNNYPAIRLNIDTPIFGLDTIIDSKLKITKDVSPSDIANSYSIKSIIKNSSLKVPDTKFGNLVLTTREIKFNNNISISDANTAILKLIQYEKTLDNIDVFIDDQINKFFKGYIPKDKEQNISNISMRLDRLDTLLLDIDNSILNLELLAISEEEKAKYLEVLEKFVKISTETKKERKEITNMLITYDDIIDVQKRLLDVETNMSSFSKDIDEILKDLQDYDILTFLNQIKENLNKRYEQIKSYVKSSTISKKIETDESDNVDTKESEEVVESDDSTTEEVIVYDVVSENILDELKEYIEAIDEKIKTYKIDNSDENVEENEEKVVEEDIKEENVENDEDIKLQEKEELLKEILNIYKSFIPKENKFYIDNINLILNNTNNLISDLIKYANIDLIDSMRYIYLELPENIDKYLNDTNMNLNNELKDMSIKLYSELKKLIEIYINTNEYYKELNIDDKKTNA